ncbi:MAG: DUF4185 domain-containing protein [Proteobacteria bacterium]|nr:DUF4185 domain-containing protein [Pseudomonadota bacterium]
MICTGNPINIRICQIQADPFSFSRKAHRSFLFLFLLILIIFSGCTKKPVGHLPEEALQRIGISPYEEADRLFRKDKYWLGGDGASSVDIGNGKVLWLFGDSFIGTGEHRDRHQSVMIRNSIAIQEGYDPVHATIHFYWHHKNNKPSPFFPCDENEYVWPADGIVIRGKLFIALMIINKGRNALGFEIKNWQCVSVEDHAIFPERWVISYLNMPEPPSGLPLVLSTFLVEKKYIYGFFTHTKTHDIYLGRWQINDFCDGNLMKLAWWSEKTHKWQRPDSKADGVSPILSGGQMEFTVEWHPFLKKYMLIQSEGFGNTAIGMRVAEKLTGPWSSFRPFFQTVKTNHPGIITYAAKSHPELDGASIVLTYAVNSLDFEEVLTNNQIYFPVFLKGMIHNEK